MNDLIRKRERIYLDVAEAYGEITDEQSEQLDILNEKIEAQAREWITILKDDLIGRDLFLIHTKIAELNEIKKKLEKMELHIHGRLHNFVKENGGVIPIQDGDLTIGYATTTFAKKSTIDIDNVPKEIGKYKIELSYDEAKVYDDSRLTRKVLVDDLPEDSNLIKRELTPKIKFLKNKPKS